MDVLLALAARPDAVVTKQELMDAVWTDLYVGDEVLSTAVWELRKALGDDARAPLVIQTVPRRGYRLLLPPQPLEQPAGTSEAPQPPPAAPVAPTVAGRARALAVLAGIAAVATAIVAALTFRSATPAAPPRIHALAVLPFEPLGDGESDRALADGVTDTLITDLAAIDGLRVVSRTTARSYRDTTLAMPAIARELGVEAVVEGTLARDGDRIVLNAQLIDAVSEDHLWAETYERRFEHLLDLQVEIARSIGAAIADRLEPSRPRAVSTTGPRAVTGSLLRWQFATGGEIRSDPVRYHDSVVFGSGDGNLYAVGLADGAERWRVDLGDEAVGRPLLLDGVLFAAAHDGGVAAVDAGTGSERWRFRLGTTTVCGLAAGAGVVVAADEAEQVVALDATSGRELWRWRVAGGVEGLEVGGGHVLVSRFDGAVTALDAVDGAVVWTSVVGEWLHWPVTVDGGRVLVPSPAGAVVALDGDDGRELWRTPVGFPSRLALWRDRILVGGDGGGIAALDRSSGAELWRFDVPDLVLPPVVAGEMVLAGAHDDRVYAVDAWSGALRWYVDMRTWVTTTPLAVDDLVVYGSLDGRVYALVAPPAADAVLAVHQDEGFRARPATAADRRRQVDVVLDRDDVTRPRVRWHIAADGPVTVAPAFAADAVLVASDRSLAALALEDGALRWRAPLGGAAGTVPLVLGGLVVVGARDGTVAAFGVADGAERWRATTGGDVLSTPALAVDRRTLVFGSRDGFLYAVDAADGAERWRRQLDLIHASPAVADGVVYVPSRNDRLWALTVADGTVLWSAQTADWAVADPVIWRDRVLLGACDGTFEAFARRDGARLWRFPTGADIWYRPAVVDDRVVFGSGDHHVYALDPASGRELWRRRTGNRAWSSVATWRDLVLVGSYDRQLWALETATGAPAWRLRLGGISGSPTVAGDLVAVGSGDGSVTLLELAP